jgi:D-inositol-3-phosphate glycosyltransferase
MHTSPLDTPGTGDAGGMNVVVRALADQLACNGHEVEILTRATHPEEPEIIDLDTGVRVRQLRAGPYGVFPKHELLQVTREFANSISQLHPCDVVHAHYWLSGIAAAPIAKQWGVPLVQSFHTLALMKNAHRAPSDTLESLERVNGEHDVITHASRIIAATTSERSALIKLYGAPQNSIDIISPGVDTRLFRSGLYPHSIQLPQRKFIVCVGRLQPLKAQDIVIRALALIPAEHRPALVIVGDESPGHAQYTRELHTLVHSSGLNNDVFFLGALNREDVATVLSNATLTVIPSLSETYGLVALESAAVGTPVIARKTTGLTDSVAENITGVFVHGSDPSTWARRISQLLSPPQPCNTTSTSETASFANTGTWDQLSESAIGYAKTHTWDIAAQRHITMYHSVIETYVELKTPLSF